MTENVCCPLLKIMPCGDSEEHQHLYCDPQYTLTHLVIDDDWVRVFCTSQFKECKYYPKVG